MKLKHPFVQLPFVFDHLKLSEELAQFVANDWIDHPNRLQGNSAIPLVSMGGADNDEFSGQMRETPHLARCEYMRQVMASFDEVIARSRLMRLTPHSEVPQHVDFNYHWYNRVRIHIPITTNPEVIFYCGDDQVNMQVGECWIFDSWRTHRVVNSSNEERVHLVVDTAGSAKFWRLVEKMSLANQQEPTKLPYIPEFKPALRTEKYNVSPVMAPGELEALTNELIDDFRAESSNPPEMIELYTRTLIDLAKDWRVLWLEHGWESAAIPRYRALLNNTMAQLPPQPRALVSSSNNIGIKPIIVQRILRAALFPQETSRFLSSASD